MRRAFYKAQSTLRTAKLKCTVEYYAAPSVSAISPVTYKWGGPVRRVGDMQFWVRAILDLQDPPKTTDRLHVLARKPDRLRMHVIRIRGVYYIN